jgi:hypothetical protein
MMESSISSPDRRRNPEYINEPMMSVPRNKVAPSKDTYRVFIDCKTRYAAPSSNHSSKSKVDRDPFMVAATAIDVLEEPSMIST